LTSVLVAVGHNPENITILLGSRTSPFSWTQEHHHSPGLKNITILLDLDEEIRMAAIKALGQIVAAF
jgi:hypothetical protein